MSSKTSITHEFSREDSYSPISDSSIVFTETNKTIHGSDMLDLPGEASIILQQPQIKKKKPKKPILNQESASLPSTPLKTSNGISKTDLLHSVLNPTVSYLSSKLAASSSSNTQFPPLERFKNKSKILDSNLRKVRLTWDQIFNSKATNNDASSLCTKDGMKKKARSSKEENKLNDIDLLVEKKKLKLKRK
jgi:hypothetical protein